ncbi:MAG: hypothetical protein EBX41_10190 [Chitinophagia bacterium]|nr:hypothetical protein [Chitinophagia bacterium]
MPRYSPEFAQNKNLHKKFIYSVLAIQIGVLLVALPFLYGILHSFVRFKDLVLPVLVLFVITGTVEMLRTLYHAHFWQKQFNTLQTLWMLLELSANFMLMYWYPVSIHLVLGFFITKMIAGACTVLHGLCLLPGLLRKKKYLESSVLNAKQLTYQFMQHSAIMWAALCVKSLSERNFLFPLITSSLGPFQANLFKIAHDGALFFQRISIRIVGTADTALLASIQMYDNSTETFKKAFLKLFKTVTIICIPPLYIGTFIFFLRKQYAIDHRMLLLFFVVAIGYMLEVFLSPYERILEVKRRYRLLWISYLPYLVGFSYLLIARLFQTMPLTIFVTLIHALRLLGALLMAYFAQREYQLDIPKKFFLAIAVSIIMIGSIILSLAF